MYATLIRPCFLCNFSKFRLEFCPLSWYNADGIFYHVNYSHQEVDSNVLS